MKIRLLLIICTTVVITLFGYTQHADAICMENEDWPDAPCYGCPDCYSGLEEEKLDWAPYYEFKGSELMNKKRVELQIAVENNSLREWFKVEENRNVHRYYFLQGEVPNTYGMNFETALEFENVWNSIEESSKHAPILLWNYHDVILEGEVIEKDLAQNIMGDSVPFYTIKVEQYFKGGQKASIITAMDYDHNLDFELFENGLFYLKKSDHQNKYTVTPVSVKTFGTCDARDLIEISPVLPNEKRPRSMPAGPIGADLCVPEYFQEDPDAIINTQDMCNVNEANMVRAVLDSDPVVQAFLHRHASAEFIHEPTPDEPGNPRVNTTFTQNGISLMIIVSDHDREGNCYGVEGYGVSYEMPPTGIGIGMDRSQIFDSEQINEAIKAAKDATSPRKQIKSGVPLTEIKCKEGLVPTFKIDRITPACVTESTWMELINRGWSPLRLGVPAEPNVLITYDARSVYPMRLVQDFDSRTPVFNMIFWVNNDIVPHTIVAEDQSWSVGPIEPGKIDSFAFNQTGVFVYYIKENPNATGKIVFEESEVSFCFAIEEPVCGEDGITYGNECYMELEGIKLKHQGECVEK